MADQQQPSEALVPQPSQAAGYTQTSVALAPPGSAVALPHHGVLETIQTFGMDTSRDEDLLKDSEVMKMMQYVNGLAQFNAKYKRTQQFMDDSIASQPVMAIAGVNANDELKDLNCRQLSERVKMNMDKASMHFCKGFCAIQKVIKGEYWSRLTTLFEMQKVTGGDPLTVAEISQVLPVNELVKASKSMQDGTGPLMVAAALFEGNINRNMCKGEEARRWNEKLQQEQALLEKAEERLRCKEVAVASWKGNLGSARNAEAAWNKSVKNNESHVVYLQQQREKTEEDLAFYEKQLRDYNCRCYGPFKWVWENDVALARENRNLAKSKLDELTKDISEAEKSGVEEWKNMAEQKIIGQRIEAEEILNIESGNVEAIKEEVGKRKYQIKLCSHNLTNLLRAERKVSVEHFLDAQESLQGLGGASHQGAKENEVYTEGWMKDMQFLAMILSKMARKANTLAHQEQILSKAREWCEGKDSGFVQFFHRARPILSIGEGTLLPSSRREGGASILTADEVELKLEQLEEIKPVLIVERNVDAELIAKRTAAVLNGSEQRVTEESQPTLDSMQSLEDSQELAAPSSSQIASSDNIDFVDECAADFSD